MLVRMMDEKSGEVFKSLYGHSGPVYNLSFSPDKTLLLSCSDDTTGKIIFCYYPQYYIVSTRMAFYFLSCKKFYLLNQFEILSVNEVGFYDFIFQFDCGVCRCGPVWSFTRAICSLFGTLSFHLLVIISLRLHMIRLRDCGLQIIISLSEYFMGISRM